MSDQEKKEQEILNQELSQDELYAIAGGGCNVTEEKLGTRNDWCTWAGAYTYCNTEEALEYGRPLYRPDGSVNCSATVEDGSHCHEDDACYKSQSVYIGMKECYKAWK